MTKMQLHEYSPRSQYSAYTLNYLYFLVLNAAKDRGHPKAATSKNQAESITEDVKRIRNHVLVPKNIPIYGLVYDVKSGKLVEIQEAMAAGRAV